MSTFAHDPVPGRGMAELSPVATISERTRARYVAVAAFGYSLLGVLGDIPSLPMAVNYIAIFFGLVPTTLFLLARAAQIRVRLPELLIFGLLTALAPVALLLGQDALDTLGNYLRFMFLLSALLFWRLGDYDVDRLLKELYRVFWVVAPTVTGIIFLLRLTGIGPNHAHHVPTLLFLMAYALYTHRYLHILPILVMSAISGKEALYVAILAIVLVEFLLRRRWTFALAMTGLVFFFADTGTNPVLSGLQSAGGNFARLGQFLADSSFSDYDERLINSITTNRYLEYKSVIIDWQTKGIPYLGRGLGATVDVRLGFRGTIAERSTLHNSYIVVFHTVGIPGLLFVLYYIVVPAFRILRRHRALFLAHVGVLVYALFSNTMLQSPTLVFIAALSFSMVERGKHLQRQDRTEPDATAAR